MSEYKFKPNNIVVVICQPLQSDYDCGSLRNSIGVICRCYKQTNIFPPIWKDIADIRIRKDKSDIHGKIYPLDICYLRKAESSEEFLYYMFDDPNILKEE